MLLIFTGNGKGKTTAALGQAMRTIGDVKKVLMVQFIKGPWESGEDIAQKRLWPDFRIEKKGLGFVGIGNDKIPFKDHVGAARKAMEYAIKMIDLENVDMIILDEVINAYNLKLIRKKDIIDFLVYANSKVGDIIFTGRDCPLWLIDRADLVTEMKEIKHPFKKGVYGRQGLEY